MPKERDEEKRREVRECEGCVCELEAIGAQHKAPYSFKLMHGCMSFAAAVM
jgi:hypothetical protein